MLFTWDTTDLCIVFRSWHIRSTSSLLLSLLAVALLTAGYELVREITRQYESSTAGGVDKDGLGRKLFLSWALQPFLSIPVRA